MFRQLFQDIRERSATDLCSFDTEKIEQDYGQLPKYRPLYKEVEKKEQSQGKISFQGVYTGTDKFTEISSSDRIKLGRPIIWIKTKVGTGLSDKDRERFLELTQIFIPPGENEKMRRNKWEVSDEFRSFQSMGIHRIGYLKVLQALHAVFNSEPQTSPQLPQDADLRKKKRKFVEAEPDFVF